MTNNDFCECVFCDQTKKVRLVSLDLENDNVCFECWQRLKRETPEVLNLRDEKLFDKP